MNNLPIGLLVHDIDTGKTVLMNKTLSKIIGWPRKSMSHFDGIPTYRQEIIGALSRSSSTDRRVPSPVVDVMIRVKAGAQKYIQVRQTPLKAQGLMISTIVDTTELNLLQSQVVRSERLAAAGELAATHRP